MSYKIDFASALLCTSTFVHAICQKKIQCSSLSDNMMKSFDLHFQQKVCSRRAMARMSNITRTIILNSVLVLLLEFKWRENPERHYTQSYCRRRRVVFQKRIICMVMRAPVSCTIVHMYRLGICIEL